MLDEKTRTLWQHVEALLDQGRMDRAEPRLRELVGLLPGDPWPLVTLARTLRSLERYPESIEIAREAVALNPVHPYMHYVLALALIANSQSVDAIAPADEAVRRSPFRSYYYLPPVLARYVLERYDAAADWSRPWAGPRRDRRQPAAPAVDHAGRPQPPRRPRGGRPVSRRLPARVPG